MRISSSAIYDANVAALGQQQVSLLKTQQQVATGRRIQTASDDPVAAARAISVNQADSMNTQYAANRTALRHTLSLAESNLHSVVSLLQDVHTTAVNAGNGSLTASDRRTMATELSGRLQELIGLANSTDGAGNYLFSGFQSKSQPFVDVAGVTTYNGDDGQRLAQANASRQIAASDSGADVFMRIKNGNGTLLAQASATNTGGGIISSAAVSNPALLTGNNYTLAYAGPTATTPVLPAPANIGNGVISTPVVTNSALVTGNDYSIVFGAGATTYTVNNLTTGLPVTGMTAQPYVSGQNISFDGLQFNIADGATAFIVDDNFAVSSPGYTVTNTTTAAVVLPAPPATGRVPYVSGQAISFDGMQLNIQGTLVSGDSFTVSPSVNESIFKTISDLIAALNGTVVGASLTNSLNRGLTHLDNALNNVLTTQSSLGLRLQEVDALQTAGDDLSLQYKQTLSELQDVDPYKAYSDLTQQNTTLQASLKSFAAVSNLSLFSYI
jgi:flagellar hook-associated protein 3 FlgL